MKLSILVRSWRSGEGVCQGGSGTRRRPLASHETTAQYCSRTKTPGVPERRQSASRSAAPSAACRHRLRQYRSVFGPSAALWRAHPRRPRPAGPGSNANCSRARAAAMPQTQVKTRLGQNLRSDIRARPIRPAAPARRPRARSDGRASSARRRESRRRRRRRATHRD
jgi:hypothetical protein